MGPRFPDAGGVRAIRAWGIGLWLVAVAAQLRGDNRRAEADGRGYAISERGKGGLLAAARAAVR